MPFMNREVLVACVNANYQILNFELKSWYFYCEMRQGVIIYIYIYFFFFCAEAQRGPGPPHS